MTFGQQCFAVPPVSPRSMQSVLCRALKRWAQAGDLEDHVLDRKKAEPQSQLEVLNPVSETPSQSFKPATRPKSLDGKRVGLYWNFKPGGDYALERVSQEIQARFKDVKVKLYPAPRPVPKATLKAIQTECDVVVGSTADCGSCTSHLIHDLIEFEKVGVATTAIVSKGFEGDVQHSAAAFGLPELPYAIVPYTLTSRTRDQAIADVEPVIDVLIDGITTGASSGKKGTPASVGRAGSEGETFVGDSSLDAWENMNRTFLDRGWGDGFPIVPPTREKVDAALAAVNRAPGEVLGRLAPGNGLVTIEKLAINAVMAGCDPEHLPVVVTAIEAMLEGPPASQFAMRTIALSTGPHFPILLINGPIARKLGINSGRCTLGPGRPARVNTVIGRAIRLIMMNVGHAYPGVGDMDTIGTPHKYSFCMAENEEASPWPPFHVERGFREDQSTVTVFGAVDIAHVRDYNNEADEQLNTWSCVASRPMDRQHVTRLEVNKHDRLMIVAPDHARILAEQGYGKQGVRTYICANAVTPIRWFNSELRNHSESVAPEWRWTLKADQNMLIPTISEPDRIHIVVVGGPTGKSDFARLFGQPTNTREIICAVDAN